MEVELPIAVAIMSLVMLSLLVEVPVSYKRRQYHSGRLCHRRRRHGSLRSTTRALWSPSPHPQSWTCRRRCRHRHQSSQFLPGWMLLYALGRRPLSCRRHEALVLNMCCSHSYIFYSCRCRHRRCISQSGSRSFQPEHPKLQKKLLILPLMMLLQLLPLMVVLKMTVTEVAANAVVRGVAALLGCR